MQALRGRLLAPRGHVRVAINFGNAAIARRDAVTGVASGVAVDVMNALSEALGIECELVGYDAAGKVVAALGQDEWDVAFLAIDPMRSEMLAFTPAYIRIPACYMVHADSHLRASTDVDAPGRTVAVGRGAAYDLHLSRALKHARLERCATASEAFMLFETSPLDAAAGVRRVVQQYATGRPHLRVLEDNFLAIDQALCVPRARIEGREAESRWLDAFVERLKQSGFIEESLKRHGQEDASVAATAVP